MSSEISDFFFLVRDHFLILHLGQIELIHVQLPQILKFLMGLLVFEVTMQVFVLIFVNYRTAMLHVL